MSSFKMRLKIEHGIKAVFFIVLLTLFVVFFLRTFKEERYQDLFKPTCSIKTIEDYERCKKENQYVTITTDQIYETDYTYQLNGKEQGVFIDIDIEGKSLIALVSKEESNKLLSGETKTITGFIDDNKDLLETKDKIIEQYKEQGNTDEIKEDIASQILDFVINSYDNKYEESILYLFIDTLAFLLLIYYLGKNIFLFLNPYYQKDLIKLSKRELNSVEKAYQKDKGKSSKTYRFHFYPLNTKVTKRKQ